MCEIGELNELWAKYIINELIHHGVRYFCISPGSRSTPITMAIAENPKASSMIHFDERGMSFHALGYAKATNSPVALIVTSGTAVGNIFPAIMESSQDRVPLIILTADRPPELRDTGANQTGDQVKIYRDYVRWQFDLPCPTAKIGMNFLGTTIAEAIAKAKSEPKGPVHLNCMFREPPFSIGVCHSDRSERSTHTLLFEGKKILSKEEIEHIAERLSAYEKGVILVGSLKSDFSLDPIYKLSEILQWPIFPDILSEMRSQGAQDGVIPYYDQILKSIGPNEDFTPDAILQFGDRFVSKKLLEWIVVSKPKVYLQLVSHNSRKDPSHSITHRISCDLTDTSEKLSLELWEKNSSDWLEFWKSLNESTEKGLFFFFNEKNKLSEPYLFHSLSTFLTPSHLLFIGSSMPIRDGDSFLCPKEKIGPIWGNRGLSGIDGNIATAIGIAKGLDMPLIAIIGDLTFLHDLTSLAQLKQISQTIYFIVINNDGGGIFHFLPILKHKPALEPFFTSPHSLDLKHAAPLFGLSYESPKSITDLKEILKRPSSTLIEIHTNKTENLKLHEEITSHIKEILSSIELSMYSI